MRGRIGVVVLDHGSPRSAERAAGSARDPELAPRILIVENGSTGTRGAEGERLCLPENRGFGGGMNAGIARLSREGCDRFLLLNSDAVLEPGCLRLLAEALEESTRAAVGPVIVSESSGLVESRGLRIDLRWGRVRLEGQGERPDERVGTREVAGLSAAVVMLSSTAVERIGLLDAAYFFGFEDLDWCLRARRAGLTLAVVEGARARHVGSQTIGRRSADRFYYATRNHLRCVEGHLPRSGIAGGLRRLAILALNLAFALRQGEAPRGAALLAACGGWLDARRGHSGPRWPRHNRGAAT